MEVTERMRLFLFWVTYNRCSGNLTLLQEILPQVMGRKYLMMVLSFHVAQHEEKYKGAAVHASDMDEFPLSSRYVLRGVSCDEHKIFLTSEVLL
jgi:hypothetical protein